MSKTENIGVPVLKDEDGLHVTDSAKAESLSRQFSSVFSRCENNDLPDLGHSPYNPMDDIVFTQKGIEKQLQQINPSKAGGPDGLSTRVLKETACSLAP